MTEEPKKDMTEQAQLAEKIATGMLVAGILSICAAASRATWLAEKTGLDEKIWYGILLAMAIAMIVFRYARADLISMWASGWGDKDK